MKGPQEHKLLGWCSVANQSLRLLIFITQLDLTLLASLCKVKVWLPFCLYLQFFLYLQRGVAFMTSAHSQWLSRLPLCWAHVVELTISALSQSSYGLFVTEGRTLLWLTSCFCLTTFTWNLFPWIHQCIPVTAIVKEAKLDAVIWTLSQES